MKLILAIIKPFKLDEVREALTGIQSLAVLKPANAVGCPADVPGAGAITCSSLWWQRRLQAVRAASLAVIARDFPQPQAALLSGILLGVDSGLPRALQDDFRTTGTAHIIAISGFNISVIAAVLMRGLGSVLGSAGRARLRCWASPHTRCWPAQMLPWCAPH